MSAPPPTIRLGSAGDDVLRWQGMLVAAGFPVEWTGAFDAQTDSATRAWQASKGLVADGIVGPASWASMTGQSAPVQVSSKAAEAHRFGREVLRRAWRGVTGQDPNLAELQIAGAQAHLESGYGRASYKNRVTGETAVINNWGAVQAGKPPCGPDSFETTDTHADGAPYQWCYKRYATPEEGAAHLIQHMTLKRPASWEHMKRGDIDAWAAQMRSKDPITGTGLYFEQSVEGRAKGIELRVREIAAAHNEPIAAKRGGAPSTPAEEAVSAAAKVGGVGALGIGLVLAIGYLLFGRAR